LTLGDYCGPSHQEKPHFCGFLFGLRETVFAVDGRLTGEFERVNTVLGPWIMVLDVAALFFS
jgi:hypothetical protein